MKPLARIAGVDEAGRGPLAGPVFAAAVILDPQRRIRGLADSKQLSPEEREALVPRIYARAVAWSVAWADCEEIDALNILGATHLAMRRALMRLPIAPTRIRVDGDRPPCVLQLGFDCKVETIVGGDALVPAISAASILAKTWRDAVMRRLDECYPGYAFAAHKGYPTPEHLEALRLRPPSPVHRRSFAPVREAEGPRQSSTVFDSLRQSRNSPESGARSNLFARVKTRLAARKQQKKRRARAVR